MRNVLNKTLTVCPFLGLFSYSDCYAVNNLIKEKPNFILINIDDLGYGDIEPFGGTLSRTPNMNKMAEEGIRFTSFYACSLSSPSRAALMTGCYAPRVGLGVGEKALVIFPGDSIGINSDEFTLAEMFKQAGYKTGCFGKWHLGDHQNFSPLKHGFDEFYGLPYSCDMWPINNKKHHFPVLPIIHNETVVETVDDMDDQGFLCYKITNAAISFMRKNSKAPFFAYIPHAFVHRPRRARQMFMENAAKDEKLTEDQISMKAEVEELDWSLGQIMKEIRKLGIENNTIVLLTSDNGGNSSSCNLPFRGMKGSTYEGGCRVSTIFWGKGCGIPANAECEEIASNMDLLPTFANLLKISLPNDRVIDGRNIWPLITGVEGAVSPHKFFYYFRGNKVDAVRYGDWKYRADDNTLYNLKSDVGEVTNVVDEHRDIASFLKSKIMSMREDINKNSRKAGHI